MKTFFIEIVCNKDPNLIPGSIYLSAVVKSKDLEAAKEKVFNYYLPFKTEGGGYKIQCAWAVSMPTREIIEKHWKKASMSEAHIMSRDSNGNVIRVDKFNPDNTKKDVLNSWDILNITWAHPNVFFDNTRGGYSVQIHGYMTMPTELKFFKGNTRETFLKAKAFIKDNTFKGDVYKNQLP